MSEHTYRLYQRGDVPNVVFTVDGDRAVLEIENPKAGHRLTHLTMTPQDAATLAGGVRWAITQWLRERTEEATA